jgi:hypothetical protein
MLTRSQEIMREVCQDFEAELKQFNGEKGHVHRPVHNPPVAQGEMGPPQARACQGERARIRPVRPGMPPV